MTEDRHATPRERAGGLRCRLRQRRVRLCVRDNGVGLPAGLDWRQARTLGLRLVQMLAVQLDGTVEVRVNDGTEFEVAFGPSGR